MNTPLTAREVSEQLSFREFCTLMRMFDMRKSANEKPGEVKGAFGYLGAFSTEVTLKARTLIATFDIFEVERGEKLYVTCQGEDGEMMKIEFSDYKPERKVILFVPEKEVA